MRTCTHTHTHTHNYLLNLTDTIYNTLVFTRWPQSFTDITTKRGVSYL